MRPSPGFRGQAASNTDRRSPPLPRRRPASTGPAHPRSGTGSSRSPAASRRRFPVREDAPAGERQGVAGRPVAPPRLAPSGHIGVLTGVVGTPRFTAPRRPCPAPGSVALRRSSLGRNGPALSPRGVDPEGRAARTDGQVFRGRGHGHGQGPGPDERPLGRRRGFRAEEFAGRGRRHAVTRVTRPPVPPCAGAQAPAGPPRRRPWRRPRPGGGGGPRASGVRSTSASGTARPRPRPR